MRRLSFCIGLLIFWMSVWALQAQSQFDIQDYSRFLEETRNMTADEFLHRYEPQNTYFTSNSVETDLSQYAYMDTILMEYRLTEDELNLLRKHHFVVTERLSHYCMAMAFFDVYSRDLPVFITTDAILQALHASYDGILMDLEIRQLLPKLKELMDALYDTFPRIQAVYAGHPAMHAALSDVDLYITIAKSLLAEEKVESHLVDTDLIDRVWNAIQSEQYQEIPLFSERKRKIDFSQFRPRGHYTQRGWDGTQWMTLSAYFKAMMWLGRIEFYMTPPPENPWEPSWTSDEIRRMNLGAVLLNELLDISDGWYFIKQIEEVLCVMVGESDNLTSFELKDIVASLNIQKVTALLNNDTYDAFQEALLASPMSEQKILGNILVVNPFNPEPDELPVSFRLFGQRFIIDSYIFSNVVYDRIIYNGRKVHRPLPDPLDAMFVLGNDNVGQLLQEELDKYHYAPQMAALRYLVDAYDDDFWSGTLYNCWLQAIRMLNPPEYQDNLPFFMKTVAWQHEKLNTQLASWAQLRHDNLLYAKQSYTGMSCCSFPHSYVEPNPDFYREVGNFAEKASAYLQYSYFDRLKGVMDTLTVLAQKELDNVPFNDEEKNFLQFMLFEDGGSGAPPFSGWYADLFYNPYDAGRPDFLVADVHTQPTDEFGNLVGRVLHTGVGYVNLGIFLANSPSNAYQPMAFVGPVMSYYEKVTDNFDRLTDERWFGLVRTDDLPDRPDWVNVYLAQKSGNKREEGRMLDGETYTRVARPSEGLPSSFQLYQNIPNPFNPTTTIRFDLAEPSPVRLAVFNVVGQKIRTLLDGYKPAGNHSVQWDGKDDWGQDVGSGVYLYRLTMEGQTQVRKMFLVR